MEKQKLKERKINQKSHITLHTSHNSGITLVALIITIIVLLILAVVAIRAVQGDGIIQYAKDASVKTKISQIQEELELKKGELLAENLGEKLPYNLNLDDLKISEDLKNEYGTKLKIGKDGKLYYDPNEVTSEAEQEQLKELGISEYQEEPAGKTYTFTLNDLGTWIEKEDSIIGFDVNNVWSAVGENLSENNNYSINPDSGLYVFNIDSDSEQFAGIVGFQFGETIGEKVEFLVGAQIVKGEFIIQVLDEKGDMILGYGMTHQDFMNTYGNVIFEFMDLSSFQMSTE